MKPFFASYLPWALTVALFFVLPFGRPFFVPKHHLDDHYRKDITDNNEQYDFIRPLLNCADNETTTDPIVDDIEMAVRKYIESKQKDGTISDAAVYYRDLNNGPWFGINETKKFSPASIHKIPLAISVYSIIERDPIVAKKSIKFSSNEYKKKQYFPPSEPLVPGESYTVGELVEHLLKYSDNQAIEPLEANIDTATIADLYDDIGIVRENNENMDMSAREIVRLFRILYNATYLSREYSEKILKIMSNSSFIEGIRAGVPAHVAVSHKFGETGLDGFDQYQLHDCGIVYTQIPYAICVMTKGSNMQQLPPVIARISGLIYSKVTTYSK